MPALKPKVATWQPSGQWDCLANSQPVPSYMGGTADGLRLALQANPVHLGHLLSWI